MKDVSDSSTDFFSSKSSENDTIHYFYAISKISTYINIYVVCFNSAISKFCIGFLLGSLGI